MSSPLQIAVWSSVCNVVEHLLHGQRLKREETSLQVRTNEPWTYKKAAFRFRVTGYRYFCRNCTFEKEVETDGQGSLT